jgi:hypothetical protein
METPKSRLILAAWIAALAIGAAVFSISQATKQEIKIVAIQAGPDARTADEPEIIPPNPNAPNDQQNK